MTIPIWQMALIAVCAVALLGLLWARANERKQQVK